MKILIAYDGSLHAKDALKYGISRIKESGGWISVLHVFNSLLFLDYNAGPRAEEVARKEAAKHVKEAGKIVEESGMGMYVKFIEEEGLPTEEIIRYAKSERADLILSPPGFRAIIKRAPCPVSIIPGTILVPVDNTESVTEILEHVIREAKESHSGVLFLGIVPEHLYNRSEKAEIELIRKETSVILKKAREIVSSHGIETNELFRSGYPDEEILKVADAHNISMIMIPQAGESPSELSKAGIIISEERRKLSNRPLVLVPTI